MSPSPSHPHITGQESEPIDGFRGIWYPCGTEPEPYRYKYSGGLATYPQQVVPIAVYSAEVQRTYFVYGGASAQGHLQNVVSYFDHRSGTLAQPRVVHTRDTVDAHFNATLAIDRAGHIYVFANSHGRGHALTSVTDETSSTNAARGRSIIYRSNAPHDVTSFSVVHTDNFSYSQPWPRPEGGLLWLHTRYIAHPGGGDRRQLYVSLSPDGLDWSAPPKPLVQIEKGSYAISRSDGQRVVVAFDVHPEGGGLDARCNVYALELDLGTGQASTLAGDQIEIPLSQVDNPALLLDTRARGELAFLKDVAFDNAGRPAVLLLTSRGARPGPDSGPREWYVLHYDDDDDADSWALRLVGRSDHNYDHGSLFCSSQGWDVLAPLQAGPQPWATGGIVVRLRSTDEGRTWTQVAQFPVRQSRNQTYVRGVHQADPAFQALWADGDALNVSPSTLYMVDATDSMYMLPETSHGEWRPQPLEV